MRSKKRVLAVDDSLTMRKLIEAALQPEGFEVIESGTGGEAMSQALQMTPDLIILDHMLPDMHSTEICQWLLKNPSTQNIPVLLISSNSNALHQNYNDLGNVADYLAKPFAATALKAVVAHLLKSKGADNASSIPIAEKNVIGNEADSKAPAHEIAFRCSSDFATLEYAISYLMEKEVSGLLRIDLGEELVTAYFQKGVIRSISSNHARNYCLGAIYDFHTIAHTLITEAVEAHQRESLPFFISLSRFGMIGKGDMLDYLLRAQGEQTLVRALIASSASYEFVKMEQLPDYVQEYGQKFSFPQVLLATHRLVDNWEVIEGLIPSLDCIVRRHAEFDQYIDQLQLEKPESSILALIDGPITIQAVADASEMECFDVCKFLYGMINLGLLEIEPPLLPSDVEYMEEVAVPLQRNTHPATPLAQSASS